MTTFTKDVKPSEQQKRRDMEEVKGEERFKCFLQWATDLGISDSPSTLPTEYSTRRPFCLGQTLSVSHFPTAGGRGLAAVRDLRKGELILRVPKSALMTSERLMKDQTLSIAVKKYPSLSSTQILRVALLNEVGKKESSLWYPYLMQMPQSYDITATFGNFIVQALQVDDAIWAAEKAVAKAKLEWKEVVPLMNELKLIPRLLSMKAWLWATATISSRTMHVPWDDAGCLCPVGDFFNYAAPGEESLTSEDLRMTDAGYEESVDSYCFYARRNYQKGEQVLLSYGTYTNLELLEHYGFLLDDNPNDKAFIFLEPEIYSLCPWSKESLYIHDNGKPSFALLSALRLWAAPSEQRRFVRHLACSGSQISVENEKLIMAWLAKNCQVILNNFLTSIEDDKQLLCTINKLLDMKTIIDIEKVLPSVRDEFCAFLESCHLPKGETVASYLLPKKARTLMERWKLAVFWRFQYKNILSSCITYCTETIGIDVHKVVSPPGMNNLT